VADIVNISAPSARERFRARLSKKDRRWESFLAWCSFSPASRVTAIALFGARNYGRLTAKYGTPDEETVRVPTY